MYDIYTAEVELVNGERQAFVIVGNQGIDVVTMLQQLIIAVRANSNFAAIKTIWNLAKSPEDHVFVADDRQTTTAAPQ